MTDLSAIEDVRIPDSTDTEIRVGELWREGPAVITWLRHYG